ncbi:MAG: DUF2127 domain-containing protein [Gammaproteobacteria bacterium]|nr:DUF2127 domain-containing protein [Gammaproteobacteria bacterium]
MIRTVCKKYLHWLFILSVAAKGLDGLLETVGGLLVLLASRMDLTNLVIFLTAPELAEDPTDLVANYLRHAAYHLSTSTKNFATAYLLINGIVKMVLVTGLLRGQRWSYRPALVLLVVFVGYQFYRFTHTHSMILLGFMCLDLLAVGLIWIEYRGRRGSWLRNPAIPR